MKMTTRTEKLIKTSTEVAAGTKRNGLHILGMSVAAAALKTCAVIMACILSSCERKEVHYPSSPTAEVQVRFDRSAAPGARVEGMCAWFFPEGGGKAIRYDFTDPAGGTVRIPWGNYRVVCMNNDSEVVQIRGEESYETFELYTRQSTLLEAVNSKGNPPGANPAGEPVVAAPDAIWGGNLENVRLERGDDEKALRTVVLPVLPKTSTVSLEVLNVENLKYISSVGASLSGLSGSFFLGSGAFSAVRSTVPFAAESDGKSKIKVGTQIFGLSANADTKRTLTLYFIFSDGSKHHYRFDVSNQVNKAPDKRHIRIVIDKLTLPKPIVNGGGFHPSVEEWDAEERTLKL